MVWYNTWNKYTDENISCWYCQHFQRYDNGGGLAPPQDCEGECRKEAPRNAQQLLYTNGGGPNINQQYGFFAFIPYSNIQWCNGFQRSLEQDIPPAPGNPGQVELTDCPHTDITTWITPIDFRVQPIGEPLPYSKNPMTQSCWTCAHFSRTVEDLSIPEQWSPMPSRCSGNCNILPPDSFYLNTPPGTGNLTENFPAFVTITAAPAMWCNRWERSRLEVPPVPDDGSGPCVQVAQP